MGWADGVQGACDGDVVDVMADLPRECSAVLQAPAPQSEAVSPEAFMRGAVQAVEQRIGQPGAWIEHRPANRDRPFFLDDDALSAGPH